MVTKPIPRPLVLVLGEAIVGYETFFFHRIDPHITDFLILFSDAFVALSLNFFSWRHSNVLRIWSFEKQAEQPRQKPMLAIISHSNNSFLISKIEINLTLRVVDSATTECIGYAQRWPSPED